VLDDLYLQVKMHGGDIDGAGSVPQSEAQKILDDPLVYFPNDVDFNAPGLKKDSIMPSVKRGLRLIQKAQEQGREIPEEVLKEMWTPERADALFGSDPVAKRASVNHDLWWLYTKSKEDTGKAPTVQELKQFVEADLILYRFFPSEFDYEKENAVRKKNNLPPLQPRRDILIPDWHMKRLHEHGAFEKWGSKLTSIFGARIGQ